MNKKNDIHLLEEEYFDEDYYEEIEDEIDYSMFSPEDAKRLKEEDEEFFKEIEKMFEYSEEQKKLTKNPEYMRNVWYETLIELGWSHREAKKLAAKKVKENFGL